ncbi:MAG: SAM-dependent DNA methyltransferase, partial [Chloroflexales bacterium]|nr:SAM-dependent DNA methyltransferase [Chloroflexales bacterium]
MPSAFMLKRHKDLLRAIVAGLRLTLAGDLDRELERLGVAPDGALTPRDGLPSLPTQERRAAEELLGAAEAKASAGKAGASAAAEARRHARADLVEGASYSWISRLLALRAMEARGLIDETLRSNPDYDGRSEALFALRQSAPARADGADGGWRAVIEDACKAQAAGAHGGANLPGLFDLDGPAVVLRPSSPALVRCIQIIGAVPAGFTLDEADAAFADPDALGWAYQFYQEAAKARVYAKLGAGGKAATRAEIAAATQLFTEPYMVQWLLQNSLGRAYHEAYPGSQLPATWAYYIRSRPEGQAALVSEADTQRLRPLEDLDLIDPCCGSGHFLREAFDMFAAMYREQHPELSAAEIAGRVLSRHIHGIDLDPRAAQLATLTLYLRAWELVKAETRKQRRTPGTPSSFILHPSSFNIAATPSGLSAGALQRHLRRHPEDRGLEPLLEGVFAALEQADILGSLLRPAEHIDAAIRALEGARQIAIGLEGDAALRRTLSEIARHDPAELRRDLLDRVATSFAAEAGDSDAAARLFGREAAGVRLLQLLDRKYALVVTNPPYMGSGNMDALLKTYVEHSYKAGKRDLYAACIMRCLDFSRQHGSVALITQQGWMFLRSFVKMRAGREGLLRANAITALAHLGSGAFDEISGEVVQNVMFVLRRAEPSNEHRMYSMRLIGLSGPVEKAQVLRNPAGQRCYFPRQADLLAIPESPLVYWLSPALLNLLRDKNVSDVAQVSQGMATANDGLYVRNHWEAPLANWTEAPLERRWVQFEKGGGYGRWFGNQFWVVSWRQSGCHIKASPTSVIRNEHRYFTQGWTYSYMAQGSLALRLMQGHGVFAHVSSALFPTRADGLAGFLNCRFASYIVRSISARMQLTESYVTRIPVPARLSHAQWAIQELCVALKRFLAQLSVLELTFNGRVTFADNLELVCCLLHTAEGVNEQLAFRSLALRDEDRRAIIDETGTPAGFHPLAAGYDALLEPPADLDLPPLPQEVLDYLAAHERIAPPAAELRRLKERLRGLYEAGPGVKESEEGAEAAGGESEGDVGAASGAHLPIPTETFLEELSVKMQLHPISVYWLLEELRREGARCKPEERRLLEDRLAVLVLRLLGHRWPGQIEAGEPAPPWADPDGIIGLTPGADGLAERVRARLRAEDGDGGANRTEGLLAELTGLSLEAWLRR